MELVGHENAMQLVIFRFLPNVTEPDLSLPVHHTMAQNSRMNPDPRI